MRTVEDHTGRKFLLLKASASTSLVQDIETGERTYRPHEELTAVEEDPLRVAGRSVPDPVRARLPDQRTAGLCKLIAAQEDTSVRSLLDRTELCESDLFGMLRELEAAGMIERTESPDYARYSVTDEAPFPNNSQS